MKKIAYIPILCCLALVITTPAPRILAQAEDDVKLYLPLLARPREPVYTLLFTNWSEISTIWRIDADGKNLAQLTDFASCCESWSPNGETILFSKEESVDAGKIYRMNADGSDKVWLGQRYGYNPVYSPDGTKIAYHSNRDGDDEIFIMNADGSHEVQLTDNDVNEGAALWSPDGQKLVFIYAADETAIAVINADGSNYRIFATPGENAFGPSWSPDGSKIAFVSYISPGIFNIMVINADGTSRYPITTNGHASNPAWSPDGTQIVYGYHDSITQTHHIHTVGVDGMNDSFLCGGLGYVGFPSLSPDGRLLAFSDSINSPPSGFNRDIYVFDLSTYQRSRLTIDPGAEDLPIWSPVKLP